MHSNTMKLSDGAGANILRGVAGAGVLALYDKYVIELLHLSCSNSVPCI